MQVKDYVSAMNDLVSGGQIIDAIDHYFADVTTTKDFDGTLTNGKDEMLQKMNHFLAKIEAVNQIKHHQTICKGQTTLSEFTFDFDMKDGSHILWHEIIKRQWEGDKVVHESYFKN